LPFFSVAGTVTCFFLITQLQLGTWVRYGLWFLVGIGVYMAYGFWHSRLRTQIAPPAGLE
jgi:hypothetical protein